MGEFKTCNPEMYAVLPKAVIGEPSAVFNFPVLCWIGVLKLLSCVDMLSI